MEAQGKLIQLIDENGKFQKENLENFIDESSQFSRCGLDYHIISITGPQSSGKSTLLNSLFKCGFRVMNEDYRRIQTTRGIQIAKSIRPCGIIIDTEGSDGKERGLDDTSFEKRSALFTLLISDIIILNMWHTDIGRANGSGLPLLQIIFQERMRLEDKQPPRPRKLLVILRDTPENSMAEHAAMEQIKENVKEVWDSVAQQVGKKVELAVYFELCAFPLPHYNYCRNDFDAKVAELRRQLSEPIAATVDRFPIFELSQGIDKIWTTIQNNGNLDVPSIRELVSIERCTKIAKKMSESFKSREDYNELSKALDAALLPNFRDVAVHLLNSCMEEYNRETSLDNRNTSAEYGKKLLTELFEIMKCQYEKNILHIANDALKLFKNSTTPSKEITTKMLVEFEKTCEDCAIPNAGWNWSQVKQLLEHRMDKHQSEFFKIEAAKKNKRLAKIATIVTIGAHAVSLATGVPMLGSLTNLLMTSAVQNQAGPSVQDETEADLDTSFLDPIADILDNLPS